MKLAMALLGKEEVQRQMRAAMDRCIQSVGDAVELSTRMLLVRIEDRHFAPRQLNIQDFESARRVGRAAARREAWEARVSTDRQEGEIRANRVLLKNRSKAAMDVISRYEGGDSLEREGLWMRPHPTRAGRVIPTHDKMGAKVAWARGRTDRSGMEFFAFASHPKLYAWAKRRDRGRQYLRNVSVVQNAEVVLGLIMGPALAASREEIIRNLQVAAERGFVM